MINVRQLPRPALAIGMLVVALLSWHFSSSKNEKAAAPAAAAPHIPNYFVRNLDMVSLGLDGRPERHIETINMIEYLDDETTEMETPFYTFYRPETPPWKVNSEMGWLSADGELALLSGRVTMTRAATLEQPPIKMVTSEVRIHPSSNYTETDNHVKITSGKDVITAVGMQAWLNEPGRVKFLSDVRATYEPRR